MFAQKSPSGDFCYDAGVRRLLREVKAFYKKEGRGYLPWRKTRDPYKILVSEVMLQQTQVDRVVPFYKRFLKRFPSVEILSRAKLSEVLLVWQGLGYNRRAKFLHEAAKRIVQDYEGTFPNTVEEMEKLSGIGPYTARAVAAFAFNKSEVFIETNIRSVFLYLCFSGKRKISDKQILPLIVVALTKSRMQPRDFYAALMDYGNHLKRRGIKVNVRSKQYLKQATFKGSTRQLRGVILRELLKYPLTSAQLIKKFSPERSRGEITGALIRLQHEGLIAFRTREFFIP